MEGDEDAEKLEVGSRVKPSMKNLQRMTTNFHSTTLQRRAERARKRQADREQAESAAGGADAMTDLDPDEVAAKLKGEPWAQKGVFHECVVAPRPRG